MFLCVRRTPLNIFGSYLFSHSWISSLNEKNYCSFICWCFFCLFVAPLLAFFDSRFYFILLYYWYSVVRRRGIEELNTSLLDENMRLFEFEFELFNSSKYVFGHRNSSKILWKSITRKFFLTKYMKAHR